uniref:Periplasmic protein n=1 Tax=mine drainage metagenome TaxID=410659 RepID=E6PST1_9ZZZZ
MDNAVITAKVKAMLMKDEMLKSLDIHVDTKQDVVTLSGTVKNMKDSERAVRIASAVEGVKMVKNELQQKTKK